MPSLETPVSTSSARTLTYAAYASFVPIGVATVLLGPLLPALSARWSLNDAQAGVFFPVQYTAATCGVALSGWVVASRGYRFAIKLGLLLVTLGLAFLLAGSKWSATLCILIYGCGLGLAVPAANLMVAAANPERRSAKLNLLNFFWSFGAVACPFLLSAAEKVQRIPSFLLCVSAFSLVIAIGVALMPGTMVEPAATVEKGPILPLIRAHMAPFLIFVILFFVYVGVENSFGLWIATYVKSLGTLTPATAVATPSFFYASLMIGRWLAPALLRLIDDVRLVQAGLLLACVGMLGLMLSHHLPAIAASACAAGFGLASVYPITISLLSRQFASAQIGSAMFFVSNIGGGLLPWIVGLLSTRFGSLRVGLYVPLLGCLTMYAFYVWNWRPSASAPREPRE
ncbi:MAG TPA: MFS transporter [Dongiaceae bacterium]|nr:MFS transporter [Dongiaceae bacterium]